MESQKLYFNNWLKEYTSKEYFENVEKMYRNTKPSLTQIDCLEIGSVFSFKSIPMKRLILIYKDNVKIIAMPVSDYEYPASNCEILLEKNKIVVNANARIGFWDEINESVLLYKIITDDEKILLFDFYNYIITEQNSLPKSLKKYIGIHKSDIANIKDKEYFEEYNEIIEDKYYIVLTSIRKFMSDPFLKEICDIDYKLAKRKKIKNHTNEFPINIIKEIFIKESNSLAAASEEDTDNKYSLKNFYPITKKGCKFILNNGNEILICIRNKTLEFYLKNKTQTQISICIDDQEPDIINFSNGMGSYTLTKEPKKIEIKETIKSKVLVKDVEEIITDFL